MVSMLDRRYLLWRLKDRRRYWNIITVCTAANGFRWLFVLALALKVLLQNCTNMIQNIRNY
jgi:hypothetical protein